MNTNENTERVGTPPFALSARPSGIANKNQHAFSLCFFDEGTNQRRDAANG
ncbi:hypothetical protein HDC94_001969 [Leifsonia sp. AK011]|nr:hypothetical protein [Leifsonia sp. AK011]